MVSLTRFCAYDGCDCRSSLARDWKIHRGARCIGCRREVETDFRIFYVAQPGHRLVCKRCMGDVALVCTLCGIEDEYDNPYIDEIKDTGEFCCSRCSDQDTATWTKNQEEKWALWHELVGIALHIQHKKTMEKEDGECDDAAATDAFHHLADRALTRLGRRMEEALGRSQEGQVTALAIQRFCDYEDCHCGSVPFVPKRKEEKDHTCFECRLQDFCAGYRVHPGGRLVCDACFTVPFECACCRMTAWLDDSGGVIGQTEDGQYLCSRCAAGDRPWSAPPNDRHHQMFRLWREAIGLCLRIRTRREKEEKADTVSLMDRVIADLEELIGSLTALP